LETEEKIARNTALYWSLSAGRGGYSEASPHSMKVAALVSIKPALEAGRDASEIWVRECAPLDSEGVPLLHLALSEARVHVVNEALARCGQ
jgi:hypothetical protein